MKKLFLSKDKISALLFAFLIVVSLAFNLYQRDVSPPGFNADEAAFGYNAYSILKTGKDEYGNFLPIRLKSFGDYKMPLYSYLSIPFIAVQGLNESSVRNLNTLVALLFPFAVFFLTKELFGKKKISFLSAFLVATSLGLNMLGRQAHEAYLASFFAVLSSLFVIRSLKYNKNQDIILSSLFLLLALFSYQSSRIFGVFLFFFVLFQFIYKKTGKKLLLGIILVAIIFGITDLIYKPVRVENLLLFNNIGFKKQIIELRDEGGLHGIYNKFTIGTRDVIYNQISYFSPNFLVIDGDQNARFGFTKMSPVNLVEYIFIFVGLYFLFKKKEKWTWFLILFAFFTPLAASLSWAEASLTRSLFMLVPLIIISSYGFISFYKSFEKWRFPIFLIIILSFFFFSYYSWDFYLNHYSKRALVIRSWQDGYKDLATYIGGSYGRLNKFYITKQYGEPYIFLLFYLKYDPSSYQKQAKLTPPDEYGFGQVEGFDKFDFNVINPDQAKSETAIIGYPDDFVNSKVLEKDVKKITTGPETIFWVYEKN